MNPYQTKKSLWLAAWDDLMIKQFPNTRPAYIYCGHTFTKESRKIFKYNT